MTDLRAAAERLVDPGCAYTNSEAMALARAYLELLDERKEALRLAYERTPECQTAGEAVSDLIRQLDDARARVAELEAENGRLRKVIEDWTDTLRAAVLEVKP